MLDLRAELEDLDMEADGDDDDGGGGGARGFVPLRDDAVQCFKDHTGKNAGGMHVLNAVIIHSVHVWNELL